MNEANTKKIYETFPRLFKQKDLPATETCMCWGLCIGDGWFDLFYRLCQKLEAAYQKIPLAERIESETKFPYAYTVGQVKEKFGNLRCYMDGQTDEMRKAIQAAEEESSKTCESCGKPGTCRKGGWVLTLCDVCCRAYPHKNK